MSLRVDKEGHWISCGTDCGAKVGVRVYEVMILLPGYARDEDGILRMTARTDRRRARGQYPRPLDLPAATPGGRHGIQPGPMPVKVRCWRCGWVHDADVALLGVTSPEHDGWVVWNWDDD